MIRLCSYPHKPMLVLGITHEPHTLGIKEPQYTHGICDEHLKPLLDKIEARAKKRR